MRLSANTEAKNITAPFYVDTPQGLYGPFNDEPRAEAEAWSYALVAPNAIISVVDDNGQKLSSLMNVPRPKTHLGPV